MSQNQKFEILNYKIDYLKLIIYRTKNKMSWPPDQLKPPAYCDITEKIKEDFKIEDRKAIINYQGLGINSLFNQKMYIDFRGEFFLRNGYEYIKNLLKYLEDKEIKYKFTRIDIAVDYKNSELLPFKDKKSHFGKFKKSTVLIPEKYRADLKNPTEWLQLNSKNQIVFYDKTKEISQSKNKEKSLLYPQEYRNGQVYRFELRLIKQEKLSISSKNTEEEIIDKELKDFYKKNSFSVNSVNIKKIFKIE